AKAFACPRAIGSSGAAVPGRAGINRVAIRVSQVKGQAMPRLRLQRGLQRVIIGVHRVQPVSQTPVVGVQPAGVVYRVAEHASGREILLATEISAEVIDHAETSSQSPTRNSVDVLRTEQ